MFDAQESDEPMDSVFANRSGGQVEETPAFAVEQEIAELISLQKFC